MAIIHQSASRRLKFLRLTDYFSFDKIKQALLQVPDDVVFMGWDYNILTACHYVLLEHPSFDVVDEGAMIPEFIVTLTLTNPAKSAMTCTCGVGAVGSSGHAAWCDVV